MTTDASLVESLTTNLSSEIAAAVNEVSEANPDLAVDSAAIQENTAAGLDAGAASIPATCTFHGEVLSGYGDQGVEAFLVSEVPFGDTCESQQRTCNDGTLDGQKPMVTRNVLSKRLWIAHYRKGLVSQRLGMIKA